MAEGVVTVSGGGVSGDRAAAANGKGDTQEQNRQCLLSLHAG